MGVVGTSVFLLVFFLLNLRRDPVVEALRRLRRLEREVVGEVLEGRDDLEWTRKRKELEARKGEIRNRVLEGLRVPPDRLPEVERFLDRVWDEVLRVAEAVVGEGPRLRRLEELLEDLVRRLEEGVAVKGVVDRLGGS